MRNKILLIDDDVLVLKTLEKVLARQGYEVLAVSDGDDACKALKGKKINLIISDIRMPRLSGIDTMRKIRNDDQTEIKQTPIILITGYASEEAPIDAVKLGAKDYLLKPFDLDELIKSVQKNIG